MDGDASCSPTDQITDELEHIRQRLLELREPGTAERPRHLSVVPEPQRPGRHRKREPEPEGLLDFLTDAS